MRNQPKAKSAPTTLPVAVITDFADRPVLPEIPHNCLASGVSRRQTVLGLPVPRECLDVFRRLLQLHGGGQLVTPWAKRSLLFGCSQPPTGSPSTHGAIQTETGSGGWDLTFPERLILGTGVEAERRQEYLGFTPIPRGSLGG